MLWAVMMKLGTWWEGAPRQSLIIAKLKESGPSTTTSLSSKATRTAGACEAGDLPGAEQWFVELTATTFAEGR